ncbi:formylglycine-generating enzyme family protein [Streptomyces sp. NPDC049879]|uniref:formylglycine-generating enzyme family protein n=1 Tax=Streptomyces sp. NPDC049879 TaxID=3365598 RepID=UPI0037A64F1C
MGRPTERRLAAAPMCTVPAGTFRRGSGLAPDEGPVADVAMSAFAMDRDPVSNGQFARFIEDGGYRTAAYWTPAGWEFVRVRGITAPTYWDDPLWAGDPEVPVTGVSWWEALAFARWAGRTLPTEAQWEYACRGPAGRTYPWGEDPPEPALATYAPGCEPEERRPTRPGDHPRNVSPFGVRDMAGNFAEWCLDTYGPYGDGPVGPDPVRMTDESADHVVRGGCGLHDEDYLRGSARDYYHPGLRDNLIGFRCALPRESGTGKGEAT